MWLDLVEQVVLSILVWHRLLSLDHRQVWVERLLTDEMVKWLLSFSLVSCNMDGLVHGQAAVRVKPLHIFQISHLTLEKCKVISQHFPIELFTYELVTVILIILCFPCIVDITIKLNKFTPFFDVLAQVSRVLLPNVQKALSTGEIIQHNGPSGLVE